MGKPITPEEAKALKIKGLIRSVLIALGSILVTLGVVASGLVDNVIELFDTAYEVVLIVIGAIGTIWGMIQSWKAPEKQV